MQRFVPLATATAVAMACTGNPHTPPRPPNLGADASASSSPDAGGADGADDAAYVLDASTLDAVRATLDADDGAVVSDDPNDLRRDTREAILAVFDDPKPLEKFPFGPGVLQINQGNPLVAHRSIGKRTCVEGLRGVVVQTPEQRARCGGAENMVPIFPKGDPSLAKTCIDVFEFPNKACELPLVWMSPTQASEMCKAQGKRLCDQEEWALACRADPAGGKDQWYAYGNELDLKVCNTNKSRLGRKTSCGFQSMTDIWNTCTSDTEPAGAFPRCRSRFGVFDQHGNVAEIMTRRDVVDGHVYSQLRGSAFHYTDVAKKHTDPGGYYLRYPDHCNFEPRWHVERIEQAHHTNYHLGFRCCKSIESASDAGVDGADAGSAKDASSD